ncbi:MAG TPA: hypothetical protein ENJ75_02040 [Candidatus Kaiserbacteria bacterium]|nr:hypothetical protein [Candidatus Kaiserbacteria bacterium]
MDALAKLFCSSARLKLLRLFMFNDKMSFTAEDISFRTKTSTAVARKELHALLSVGVIRKRGVRRATKYFADKNFIYFDSLLLFLRETTVIGPKDVLTALGKAGSLRLVILTGIFTGVIEPKIDLLIVGDKLEERALISAVRTIEADFGREIRFATFSTEDFRYRYGVYDRLLRDVFDYEHRTILDKIGIS